MKAQASLEQLIVIGAALALIGVSFYLASMMSADSINLSQAQDTVERLAAAADYVYSLGPNTKEYVTVSLPSNIISSNTTGKVIALKIGTSAGNSDIFAGTRAEIIGSIVARPGKQKVLVEYLPNGKVRLGEAGLECTPRYVTMPVNSGDSGTVNLVFSNNADFNVTQISFSYTGLAKDFSPLINPLAPAVPSQMGNFSSLNSTLSYNIPSNTKSGVYGGLILLESKNGGACTVQVSFKVNGSLSCADACIGNGFINGTCRSPISACNANGEDYVDVNASVCSSTVCCCKVSRDLIGPIVSNISNTPANAISTDNITINALCDDSLREAHFIKSAQLQIDGGNWSQMYVASGGFSDFVYENVTKQIGALGVGQHIAIISCTDTAGNTGPFGYYYFNVTLADLIGPIITRLNHTETTPTTATNITESAQGTDMFTGNNNIIKCEMRHKSFIYDSDWFSVPASDGAYDSPTESFSHNFGRLSAGQHIISARCTDNKNNIGGIFNNTYTIGDLDMMLVIDRSGSMMDLVGSSQEDSSEVNVTSVNLTFVKKLDVTSKNGNLINLSIEAKAVMNSTQACSVNFQAKINNSTIIASGNRASANYEPVNFWNIDISAYSAPYSIYIYANKSTANCTVYIREVEVEVQPAQSGLDKAAIAAGHFIDSMDNTTFAGIVSYNQTATTNKNLTNMSTLANKNALKSSIAALVSNGDTCIKCGIDSAVTELRSARGRTGSFRTIILFSDGMNNNLTAEYGAIAARGYNVTIYTIGYGSDVNASILTNVALLTYGKYYFDPDNSTVSYIYTRIGEP